MLFDARQFKTWLPSTQYTGVWNDTKSNKTMNKYNSSASSSFANLSQATILLTSRGNISGYLASDKFCISNTACTTNSLQVVMTTSLSGNFSISEANGVVALAPSIATSSNFVKNLFDNSAITYEGYTFNLQEVANSSWIDFGKPEV